MAGIGPLRPSTDVRCQIATDFILTLAFWRPAAFATPVLTGNVTSIAKRLDGLVFESWSIL